MNGRDRILEALHGGVADRVPLALGFFQLDGAALAPAGEWRDDLVDVVFVRFPVSPEEEVLRRWAAPFDGDTRIGSITQAARYASWRYHPERRDGNPLEAAETLEDLERFPFPDVSGAYLAAGLAHQVDVIHALGLAAAGNPPHLGGELFEAAWRLRGFENFMLDLVERREMAHFLLDRLAALALRNAVALARSGVDVLALDDDVGAPGRLMMISPATWREFFRPRMAAIVEAARAVRPDLGVLYHSDGHIEPILDDLVEIGIDGINPLQPEHMDAVRIRRRYGPEFVLWGAVGRQTTFSFADPDEIRREVRERIETLGPAGLVLAPAYDIDEPDVPWPNVAAFLEAGRAFGQVDRRA